MSGTEPGGGRVVAGRYQVLSLLGRGGMGVVWLAEDRLIRRRVALKELRPEDGLPAAERDEVNLRAMNEARNAARVHHPNAVALYDVIPASGSDDAVYLIMELIQAPTLGELISRHGRLPEERVAAIAAQMLDVLDAAHEIGVVHRDVKPSNIMIASGDVVKLTDFGIAHADSDTRLTRPGIVVGTQAYLAPELFRGGEIAAAADMWSLGATLFHATEGRSPFERDSAAATLNAILIEEPPRPACGRPLADAISALLVREPDLRADSRRIRTMLSAPREKAKFEQETASETSATSGGGSPSTDSAGSTWEDKPTRPRPEPPPKPPTPAKSAAARPNKANQEGAGCIAMVIVAVAAYGVYHFAAQHHSTPTPPSPTASAVSSPASASPTVGTEVGSGAWVAGECVDNLYNLDSNGNSHPTIADCSQPHDGQVIYVFDLRIQADGADGVLSNECQSCAIQEFGTGDIPAGYSSHGMYPDVQSWLKGTKQAACLIVGVNHAQITAPFTPISPS